MRMIAAFCVAVAASFLLLVWPSWVWLVAMYGGLFALALIERRRS